VLRVGVIGYGYWGPNLVRNFISVPGATVSAVCDLDPRRLERVAALYPSIRTTTDPAELIADPRVDAVAIATPVHSHFDLAFAALAAGKHVLVEKPLAASVAAAARLVNEAERRRLTLAVDHTFVYTGAVARIAELIRAGELGELCYYDSTRVNLGLFQHDINVIWDLAVHDLAILDYVIPQRPTAVAATGMSHVPGEPENIAYLTLFFDSSFIAHVHVNWLAPVKVRRTMIGGTRKMILYDDVEPSEKVKVYDKGISVTDTPDGVHQLLVSYRSGDMWAPQLDITEALRTEAVHFVECIENGTVPRSDGHAGLRVVRVLEAASRSLARRGELVALHG
jgi:predicted dehydrogenase